MNYKKLKFFQTGEWQVIDEQLSRLTKEGVEWCPGRKNLFKALELVNLDRVRCVICGQDPYPNPEYATGLAFSVPADATTIPASLGNILKELQSDLGVPISPDLSPWCKQGVLLWNAIPSCEKGKSRSHKWPEWELLTEELFQLISQKLSVFAFLGSTAAYYDKYVNKDNGVCIYTTHPSPRATLGKRNKPFLGCRLFSTINSHFMAWNQEPIDWSLSKSD